VLEGVHALKHGLRFGARVERAVSPDPAALASLLSRLAPDVAEAALALTVEVDPATWSALAPRGLPSPVLAVAARPVVDLGAVLADPAPAPVVLLDDPTHLGNLGAVVRVAAAAGAAGVVTVGRADPWAPGAVRGGAGLQFAVPTARSDRLPHHDRPVVAIDPTGEPLRPQRLPPRALFAFGSERHGLSPALRDAAARRVRIPMRPGVSSLNLATAVAVVLYARPSPPGADPEPPRE
jgi:TrmH family RNA methyltransferase